MQQIHTLLSSIVDQFRAVLGDNLVGFYLHGSLVMGGFNWRTSDIDFVVVAREKLDTAIKKAIISFILDLAQDAPPKGMEFSVVLLEHTQHFTHPTPYELHYSPAWHERYLTGNVDYDTPQTDPDLAAHFMIVREYGKCLYGLPISEVFGEVPTQYYWESIRADAEDILNNVTANPVYSVLNLCRVLAFKRERLILSKVDGAAWGLKNLDPHYQPLIQQALRAYQATDPVEWDQQQLEDFASTMRQQFGD